MNISLHYGSGRVNLEIPEDNIAAMITPRQLGPARLGNAEVVSQAVERGASGFVESLRGRTVGVLLADGTRDILLDAVLPQIMPLLTDTQNILFFICTGTHNADTPENKAIIELIRAVAKKANIQRFEVIAHDCRDCEFESAGVTSRGTEVLYNKRLREPAVFLALSDVKHHYFAGYSNPIKNIVPGLCAFKTVEQNHSWTMDGRSCAGVHPWHPDPALRDNPLARDQLEAMTAIVKDRPVWALVMMSAEGRIQSADFGPAQQVAAEAFRKADGWNCFSVTPVQKMIVSPGGLPNDVDLYISQRALELTTEGVCDGGEILFLSACPNGVGSERTRRQFYDKLIEPLEKIQAIDREAYQLFSHKSWRFARLIRRLNCLWMYSQIPAGEIEKMHMAVCSDPQTVVDEWIRQKPQERILIVDGANKLLLRK